jgi:pseudaminic acid cytidylyltransferase
MNIAIVPARGSGKRIPRKNIKEFQGKPIIACSIETAVKAECFDKVIVSTDAPESQRVARHYGATCDYLRLDVLSDDFVGTKEVVKYEVQILIELATRDIEYTTPILKSDIPREIL